MLTHYKGKILYSSVDTFTNFSKTLANKITSVLQYNLVNPSPSLILNSLIISFVRSISSSSFFNLLKKFSFFKLSTDFLYSSTLLKYSYDYASFLFKYCHLSGNSFFKILKSSSSKFLTNLSKLSDKKR